MVVYHAYEQICDLSAEVLLAHRLFLETVDLVITPDIRRLIHDCKKLGVWPQNVVEIHNGADVGYPSPITKLPADDRNGRFFWCGTLGRRRTFADWFFNEQLTAYNFDLTGRFGSEDERTLRDQIARCSNISHHGIRSAAELDQMRARAQFSLVWWNPTNSFGHLHLPSNRFATTIQAGTPPICAPHPHFIEISRRFGCTILMENWTGEAFRDALAQATRTVGTKAYHRLIDGCAAAAEEFEWPRQSRRIRSSLATIVGKQLG